MNKSLGTLVAMLGMALMQPALAAPISRPIANPAPEIALTFDDLPVHGALPPGMTRAGIAARIVAAVRNAGAPPAYGFVNAKGAYTEANSALALAVWRAAGFPLGNHTYSHVNADTNTLQAWEDDVIKNEPFLIQYMPDGDWHWLRFPYLHIGDTPQKRIAIADFLKARGYRPAWITWVTEDYAYSDAYARCVGKKDSTSIAWMKTIFLANAMGYLDQAEANAQALYGRNIRQIALLHLGGFTAVMLPPLLDRLKARHTHFLTLEEAQDDPVYTAPLDPAVADGGSFLQRALRARGLAMAPGPASPAAKLDTLCR